MGFPLRAGCGVACAGIALYRALHITQSRRGRVGLVDVDGLVIFGPGSEWFWTMLSGIFVPVTFYLLYRQLRLQASSAAIDQVRRLVSEWEGEEMAMSCLEVLIAIRDGTDRSRLPASAVAHIANFWTEIGYLVEAGHMDVRLVHRNLGGWIETWWLRLLPTTLAWRQVEGPDLFLTFEKLVRQMEQLDRTTGDHSVLDEARLATGLPSSIEQAEGRIRRARQLRAVVVQPLPAATTVEGAPQPRQ
jgi:hypothetical protein